MKALPSSLRNAITLLLTVGGCLALILPLSGDAEPEEPEETRITAESLEMVSIDEENRFFFIGNVEIEGTNLSVSCDRLTVISSRAGDPDATLGQIGNIRQIVAEGNVIIEQSGRRAEAGRATINPNQGRVVLEENPVVIDSQGRVQGWRITLLRGENRAIVEGGPAGERPRVTLPTLPNLGARMPETAND
jgi:lipopolysaccharide transport protein LptA